ncbi:MAG: SDR family NAD(P)-dependent oxidoreductase [Polyangiaceae bacterium]|nr:SDR family NAD(P)-dependent oxidoreductase [Myxococcales bacterium]MCC6902116.1 SDR family NAD(P)-dependent oxidoreductase [Polyangiaceae bacterium]
MSLAGKTAVITGGGRGIGAAVAGALAAEGARVLLAARSLGQVEAAARELGQRGFEAHAAACDVTLESSVRELEASARSLLGQVDILVNNAGTASSAPIESTTLDEWNRIMAVNATGPFLCTRAFIGGMAERGWGRVVNVASVTSRVGSRYIAAYTASKHAVLGFTRVAAAEYARAGISVNAVCPGYVDTEMTTESVERVMQRTGLDRERALAAILETVNQKRLISVDEVAFVVASLCAVHAGGINGQAIVIDGGGLLS